MPDPDTLVARVPEPGTALYRHFGDTRAGLWAVHALLLQVMHPAVSAGVLQHSNFKNEAWKRLNDTMLSLATWIYGGPEGAVLEAERLRRTHVRIAGVDEDGRRYSALSPQPWTWVFATLLKGSIDAQQYFGRRLPPATLDEIWRQARELGLVMHVREQDLPDTWAGFERYFADMQATTLRRTQSADDVLDFLRHIKAPAPLRWVPNFLWAPAMWLPSRVALVITAGTLPPALRDRLGLPWSRPRAIVLAVIRFAVRAVNLLIPQRVQVLPSVFLGRYNARRLRRAANQAAVG